MLRLARLAFLLAVVALIWMKQPLMIGGLPAIPADLLFLVSGLLWVAALAAGQARLRWHGAFWLLLVYFAAMAVSASQAADPTRSAVKLLTQAYLLGLPVLAFNLTETRADLRRVFVTWIAAAAIVAAYAALTLLLFPFLGPQSWLAGPLHHFGTLPPGPYPRLELTFLFPSMLANYLTTSLMVLLVCRRLGWVGRRLSTIAGAGMVLAALFALTPSFGGMLLALGAWLWLELPDERPRLAKAGLIAGIAGAAGSVLAAAVTPILHPTAPFLIEIPGLAAPLAPSVRLLAWLDALRNFADSLFLGHGIGADAVDVAYVSPSGAYGHVTDAHNTFLSIAVQSGMVGLAGLLLVVAFAVRRLRPLEGKGEESSIRNGLAIAFLVGIGVQGLVGSFEDARHLWLAFGLLLVADALPRPRQAPGNHG